MVKRKGAHRPGSYCIEVSAIDDESNSSTRLHLSPFEAKLLRLTGILLVLTTFWSAFSIASIVMYRVSLDAFTEKGILILMVGTTTLLGALTSCRIRERDSSTQRYEEAERIVTAGGIVLKMLIGVLVSLAVFIALIVGPISHAWLIGLVGVPLFSASLCGCILGKLALARVDRKERVVFSSRIVESSVIIPNRTGGL